MTAERWVKESFQFSRYVQRSLSGVFAPPIPARSGTHPEHVVSPLLQNCHHSLELMPQTEVPTMVTASLCASEARMREAKALLAEGQLLLCMLASITPESTPRLGMLRCSSQLHAVPSGRRPDLEWLGRTSIPRC